MTAKKRRPKAKAKVLVRAKAKVKGKSTAKRVNKKVLSRKPNKSTSPDIERKSSSALQYHRFIGISLGGGKSDRTALTVLEYYVAQKKLIVSGIVDRLKAEGEHSADLRLHDYIQQFKNDIDYIAMDVPLSVPKCFRCELPCPGYEICDEAEIVWQRKHYRQLAAKKKTLKMFTPYTRRCAETYWGEQLDGAWALGDALGSNQAPLLARGRYITRRLDHSVLEVIPRLSLYRWAKNAKVSKIQTLNYRHSVNGFIAREYLLRQITEQMDLFIYEQDKNLLAEHLVAFDSLWAALTAFWKFQKRCESPPRGFPKGESWIEVPFFD